MTDRIEKSVLISSPISRVWRALTNYQEYATWFQCEFDQPFKVGVEVFGRMTIPGYEHLTFPMKILALDENRLFSCRWPAHVEHTEVDLLKEPWLLMEYHLKETSGGTLLTVIESGFDKLDASIRNEAREGNEKGWDFQLENILKYLQVND